MQPLAALLARPEPPVEGEFWDAERLHHHGIHLGATTGELSHPARRVDLRARLKSNSRTLQSAYRALVGALQAGRAISPAAEWIVDNFHVISEQLTDAPVRLTTRLWRDLPASTHQHQSGWPRIHHLAVEYLQRTLWEFQPDLLQRMLEGYQRHQPLTMRELWALYPILRIALIEELARVAVRVQDSLVARVAADAIADALVTHTANETAELQIPDWLLQPLPPPFTVQLVHRLHGIGERGHAFLDALAHALGEQGTSVDECIQRQHARRSSNNLAARNIITSLRMLASYDWRGLFEETSLVERMLREKSDYWACDRRTRDRYRHSIEDLSRGTGTHELEVTRRTLELAAGEQAANAETDLGAWLIGSRRLELERALDCPAPLSQRLRRGAVRHARWLYPGGIALLTGALIAAAVWSGVDAAMAPASLLVLLVLLAVIPASELAIGILNRIWLRTFPPRHLPRLALQAGLAPDMRTLVVMPILVSNQEEVDAACRQLHIHALANEDPQVFFALLSDWTDSPTEHRDGDAQVLAAARAGIAALNAAEPGLGEPRFYLFHRHRQWSDSEQCFMGWERKRGKLAELHRLLLGTGTTSFMSDEQGRLLFPRQIRYVLTVDADTRLPLGSVRDLVGVAAHPLNQPMIDPVERRVVRGYGVLQPRITPLLPGTDERSLYREIVTSGSGIDPYAAAVSDLYQDVFSEGLFTGKGLYDLSAWESVLAGRVPVETMLSHDLFEGIYVRCGLVGDLEFFEDFPSNSEVAAARSHRWMRGDWQLLPWMIGLHGRLPPMARWKMLDNLRRALLAPCALGLLICAFAASSVMVVAWLVLVVAPLVWPALATAVERTITAPGARSRRMHLYRLAVDFASDLARAAVWIALLAQSSWLAIDAMGRALYRMVVSRRRMLEWTTAAQLKAEDPQTLASFVWPLKSASIVVVVAVGVVLLVNPSALHMFAPLLVLWWLTPVLAQALSRPLGPRRPTPLPPAIERQLRGTARLTWTFFETFVTAEHNHLPPDNFQEDPVPVVAHRSSPTNFGMYLLSVVAARDFGWLGLHELIERLSATFGTLRRLERFRGHFLNWYDTRTLAPLLPAYVSTVDSGNLAGHLLALRQALLALHAGPLLAPRAMLAPRDAFELVRDAFHPAEGGATVKASHEALVRDILQRVERELGSRAGSLGDARARLRRAFHLIGDLMDDGEQWLPAAAYRALAMARRDVASHLNDLELVLPPGTHAASPVAQLPVDASLARLSATGDASSTTALSVVLLELAADCERIAAEMSFRFLYDQRRGLFSIGYRISDGTLDEGYYDLLASEARLASLVAIAKGDAPRSHWLRLGRRLIGDSPRPVLASWSGSMFEYLMPALVMHEPRFSLLDQTNRRVLQKQMRYGQRHGLPWGISESAYNLRDREYTYQYSGFGVPELGLKRGLASDYVVAPYASALAAMYNPVDAAGNLRALERDGARGTYGFYEALDYTTSRIPKGRQHVVVRAHMAHHQGMSLVALDNALHESIMQERFHADPRIAAADLLLQERRIRFVAAPTFVEPDVPASRTVEEMPDVARDIEGFSSATPVTHLLSNRRYTVMLTDSGAGFSRCRQRAVTRWREDATRDAWGSFIYLRDPDARRVWSAGFQPTATRPDEYQVHFSEESATILRRDGVMRTRLTVVVTPDEDGEMRQIMLQNEGGDPRRVEVTSYAEIVLAPQQADLAHPGFSNLFVQTEFVPEYGALLASRRPRSSHEPQVWAAHAIAEGGGAASQLQFETDRARFIGRGNSLRQPRAVAEGETLTGSVGDVLDPVFSLRTLVTVPARGRVGVTFVTFMAPSRAEALARVIRFRNPALFEHVLQSAWTFARTELHYLGSDLAEARLFQSLAAHLIYGTAQLRAARRLTWSTPDITHLWRHAISGDRPILLLLCQNLDELGFVRQCLRAQEYLRSKQLAIDVVILNERHHSYTQELQQALLQAAGDFRGGETEGELRGDIHVLAINALPEAELQLLMSVARVTLQASQGSLKEQLSRAPVTRAPVPSAFPPGVPVAPTDEVALADATALDYFNGWGGFQVDGREYRIILAPGIPATPAPWSNVLANRCFGSLVTERGAMCTWSINSRENQLTPWSNDPVCDPSGECFYFLDEEGEVWSPAPQPVRRPEARYEIRHGQGFSRFDVTARGIQSQLTVFVAADDPVKICHLRIRNTLSSRRRLLVCSYVEWALGAGRAAANHNLRTELDAETGAQFARNPALPDFGERVAFCDLGGRQQHCTASRHEFLGRNGSYDLPAGLRSPSKWSAAHRTGMDPCCAFAVELDLGSGDTEDLVLLIGQAEDREQARHLVRRYRARPQALELQTVRDRWDGLLGQVQIRTPDRALDLLFNRWLLYQVVACRLWGRAAFYQAGGAYGFRDQLQDVMALMVSAPQMARAQLLRAAARQFVEGDVQHWWHPPSGRGVRTHFSDDLLWLPFVTSHYLEVTGDKAVLDEEASFIEGPALPLDQEDAHYEPVVSDQRASLFEHCARALERSLATGAHGLPLMGGGDWNDGMNRVGHQGRGESVWLAWFLISCLRSFAPLAEARGEQARATRWRAHADALAAACEREAWDGKWYRRAFFDDGTPLGSVSNQECRIDSLAQSWAVLSGAGRPDRAVRAMESVQQHLVREGHGLVLLFTPPFDDAPVDPGYIKGYLPGLRENGGQYSHAAIWVLMAEAVRGNGAAVAGLLRMLNPVRHALDEESTGHYRVEPYVLAADIYHSEDNAGRGGWTWYTGAAGWMYRAVLEDVLGIRIRGNHLHVQPCMPEGWQDFEVVLELDQCSCTVRVERGSMAQPQWSVDGQPFAGSALELRRDGVHHNVVVRVPGTAGRIP